MPVQHRVAGLAVGLALLSTAGPALGQATPAGVKYPIRLAYDSTSDSTTRSMEVQRGRYFLHFHKLRVTVAVAYPGQMPPAEPDSVLVEFRTRSPQYNSTNVLTLTAPGGRRVLAVATRSHVHTHIRTTDHTLTFVLPAAESQPLLAATKARTEVGGVKVDLSGPSCRRSPRSCRPRPPGPDPAAMTIFERKACLPGAAGAGTTSLVRRRVEDIFSERYHSTIGVKVDRKVVATGERLRHTGGA